MELINLAGVVGAAISVLVAFLTWSLGRNVAALDKQLEDAKNHASKQAADIVDLRVHLADCVRRASFDEMKATIGQLDVKVERILERLENGRV